jgi:hypothetical protein
MKRSVLAIIVICFIIVSCEENFSPKEEFNEQYIASCIVGLADGQGSFNARVHLSKSYDVDGILAELNEVDPTVADANVKLSFPNVVDYTLRNDTSIYYHPFIPDSILWADYNRYGNPFITYAEYDIPIRYSTMLLEVELTNGKKLSASTQIPRGVFIDFNYDYPHGFTTDVPTFKYGSYWEIIFDAKEFNMYFTSLMLSYKVEAAGETIHKSVEIPISYANGEPVYPKLNYPGNVQYSFEAVTKFFEEFSRLQSLTRVTLCIKRYNTLGS